MIKQIFLVIFALYCNICLAVNSDPISPNIEITGTKDVNLPLENNQLDLVFAKSYFQKFKTVKLNNLRLSQKQEQRLLDNFDRVFEERRLHGIDPALLYIANRDFNVDLTMNNVPVLDQLEDGTCVTFAVTAALDALKNSGDYISQQCLLELGNTFEDYRYNYREIGNIGNAFHPCLRSGWDGFDISCSIMRIEKFGVIAKESCANAYPKKNAALSFDQYFSLSNGQWSQDFVSKRLNNPNDIDELKNSLNNGRRVVIGVMLNTTDDIHHGHPVNNKQSGLWAVPEDDEEFEDFWRQVVDEPEGHAVIVTGYNDKQQVLKIRNSWGSAVGDNGEFYMTYQYYKLYNLDAIEIYGKD